MTIYDNKIQTKLSQGMLVLLLVLQIVYEKEARIRKLVTLLENIDNLISDNNSSMQPRRYDIVLYHGAP